MSADGGSYLIHDNRVDLVFFFYFLCHIICIVFTVAMTDKDGMTGVMIAADFLIHKLYQLLKGLLVYLAQEKKEQGEDLETVAKWAEENRLHMVHLFTVNDLNHLYRGGRISRTTAVVGSMLNIKPVLHVDNDGKLTAIGKVRGRKKSLQELVKLMDEKIGSYHDTCHTIFISHGDCEEDANYVAEKVKEKYQINTIIMNQVGATIGAHSGPGTMALFFVGDER